MHRILIAEDEDSGRTLLSLLLAAEGYEVQQARDGEEALNLLKTTRFDLVLTDIVMPNLDGLGLMGKIRQIAPETPVMVMTGYVFGDADTLGADEFIAKPFPFEDLRHKIREILRKPHPTYRNH